MCLLPEFFIERDKRLKKFQSEGYIDIEDLLDDGQLTLEELYDAGLIQLKQSWSTADLYKWELTQTGKKYMTNKSYQLILIKPDKQQELLKIWER